MTQRLSNETVAAIEAQLGRPLRVLHIGNIANNAYNNARIQRQYGIEADVISYDYYHSMSTPEWEDAEFEGAIDADAPNWWGTSIKGWKRPDWFVQGPASTCLQYLRAKHLGYDKLRRLLWSALEACCLGQVRYAALRAGRPLPSMKPRLALAINAARAHGALAGPPHTVGKEAIAELLALTTAGGQPLFPLDERDPGAELLTAVSPAVEELPPRSTLGARLSRWGLLPVRITYRFAFDRFVREGVADQARSGWLSSRWLDRRQRRLPGESLAELMAEVEAMESSSAMARAAGIQLQNGVVIACRRAWHPLRAALLRHFQSFAGQFHREVGREAAALAAYNAGIDTCERDRCFVELVKAQRHEFERVNAEDRKTFLIYYAIFGAQFIDLFDFYDVVQGYSIDGCLCLVNGKDRFVSYEHGTLRSLPFGQDFYALVTCLAYQASSHVFVTNSDVLPSVERMGLDPARVVCLPHAFDDRKLRHFRDENPQLVPPSGAPPVIFSPTRQHWKDKSGSWTKGNDVLLRAAGLMAAEGRDFRLHLIEWGKEIAESRELIEELGIADKVVWVQMMQKRQLWEAYCTAHAVADQFTLPALGGVGFETMALGRRLITAIDNEQLTRFFGEAPPCLSASTVEDCAMQLRRVLDDPDDRGGLGLAAQRWMSAYHSAERIVDLQAAAYSRFLATNASQNQD